MPTWPEVRQCCSNSLVARGRNVGGDANSTKPEELSRDELLEEVRWANASIRRLGQRFEREVAGRSGLLSRLAFLAATVAAIGGFASLALDSRTAQGQRGDRYLEIMGQIARQETAITSMKADLAATKRTLSQAGRAPDLAVLAGRIERLEATQRGIAATVLATPEKAIELPMLRRDLQEIKAASLESDAAMRREIDRIYDLNKWLFGGLTLTLFAIGLGNVRRPGTKETQSKAPTENA